MKRLCLVLTAVSVVFPLLADQQHGDLAQLSLEQLMNVEVVYAASKQAQNPRSAPSSITLVTASDIERFGYRTLADILRAVRGFYVTNDRNYSYVGVRGFGRPGDYNTRILLLIDGHKLNDNLYESALIGNEFPLDVALIDRVEVVRGPSSSIYGTNAFFAVVNIITKRNMTQEAALESSSYGTWRGRLTGHHQSESGFDVIASASAMSSRGQDLYFPEFDAPETNFGVTRGTDYERNRTAFLSLSKGGFRAEGVYSSRLKGIPTGSFGTIFGDRRSDTVDGSSWLDLSYEKAVRADLSMRVRAYADTYWYVGDYAFDYPPVTINRDRSRGTWWGAEVTGRSTRFSRQTIIGGLELQDNLRQDQLNYDLDPYSSYLDQRHRSTRWAMYVQDEVRISDKVLVNAGLRQDRYWFGSHLSPRAALIVTPRHDTTIKLLYGDAFRTPNQYELFYSTDVPVQLANPNLSPERIRTYELVADRFFGPDVDVQTSAFVYVIDDLISLETNADGSLQFHNADHIDARGIESELSWRLPNDASLNVSYAWQHARLASGAPLTNSPAGMAKARFALPFAQRLTGGIEAQYLGRRLTLAGNETPPAVIANANLVVHRLTHHVDLAAGVDNLFNRRYSDPGSEEHRQDAIEQDGRRFRIQLTWRK